MKPGVSRNREAVSVVAIKGKEGARPGVGRIAALGSGNPITGRGTKRRWFFTSSQHHASATLEKGKGDKLPDGEISYGCGHRPDFLGGQLFNISGLPCRAKQVSVYTFASTF